MTDASGSGAAELAARTVPASTALLSSTMSNRVVPTVSIDTVRALGRVPPAVAVSVYSPGYRSGSTYSPPGPARVAPTTSPRASVNVMAAAATGTWFWSVTVPSIWHAPTRARSRRTSPAATITVVAIGWWFSAAQMSR